MVIPGGQVQKCFEKGKATGLQGSPWMSQVQRMSSVRSQGSLAVADGWREQEKTNQKQEPGYEKGGFSGWETLNMLTCPEREVSNVSLGL